MIDRFSIRAMIVATFFIIFALAVVATLQVFITDAQTRAALAAHERAVAAVGAGTAAMREVTASWETLEASIARGTRLTLALRVISFGLGIALAIFLYRRIARLLDAAAGFAARIEGGDFQARFEPAAGGETRVLADALNRMVDRLRLALESEADLRRRLDFLIEASPAVIYAARVSGDYGANYISANVRQQLGYAPQAFTENSAFWVDHLHPDDRERVLKEQETLFVAGRVACEYRFRHADGSWRWMHDETLLARDAQGEPQELVGSWSDVSARVELEQSINRRDAILNAVAYGAARFLRAAEDGSEARWQLAMEAVLSHLGEATGVSRVWIGENLEAANADTVMRMVSHWSRPEFSLEAERWVLDGRFSWSALGLNVEALRLRRGETVQLRESHLDPAMVENFRRLNTRAQLIAPIMSGEHWWGIIAFDDCLTDRGWVAAEVEALATAASLFGSAIQARERGIELRASLETLQSAMERLQRQGAEIERQNMALEKASRMKSEFLAVITHELRTPLNAIVGFAELLAAAESALGEEQRKQARDILDAGRELTALIARLLELAQLDAGQAHFAPEPTALRALLEAAAKSREDSARSRGIGIQLAGEEIVLPVDPRLMLRLVEELLDNALKFNRSGGEVRLSLRRENQDVSIEIADTGSGMTAEDLQRLFEPFGQLDAALTRRYGGVGIGLALASRIAALHRGRIEVASDLGQGSRFTVRLGSAPEKARS